MQVLETDRLILRWFTPDDAVFVFKLMNEPGWKRFIGDRGIDTVEAAGAYIEAKLIALYQQYGFGLYAVQLKDEDTLVGMCGLVKRDGLVDIDIGFALLASFEGQGYAAEAALAVMDYARDIHALDRVVAITNADNDRSINLLKKLGMIYAGTIKLTDDSDPVELYSVDFVN